MVQKLQAVILGVALIPGLACPAQRASDSQKTYFSALQCPIVEDKSGIVHIFADNVLVLASGYFLYQCLVNPHPFFSTYTFELGVKCAAAGLLCRAFICHVFEGKNNLKPTRPTAI